MTVAGARGPVERELRLSVPAGRLAALRAVLSRRGNDGKAATRHLKSVYFDTPEGSLAASGISLRVRRIGRRFLQTVKVGETWQAGISRRVEIEAWIDGDRPTLDAIAEPGLKQRLAAQDIWPRLIAGYETEFKRTTRTIVVVGTNGVPAHVATDLDVGEIRAGNHSARIAELELELKSGPASALFDLALAVHEEIPLRLEPRSKALRASMIGKTQIPPALWATIPVLSEEASPLSAAGTILRAALVQVAGNEAVLLETMDPEGPHQMRVAVRRLRAALSLFRKLLPGEEGALIRAEAKWLADALGEAREWDVYLAELHGPVEAALGEERRGFEELRHLAEMRQEAGYRDARADVASPRFVAFQLRLGRLVERLGEMVAETPGSPGALRAFASKALEKRLRRVKASSIAALAGDAAARHALRLEMKKFRYAAEFLSSLFERKEAKRATKAAARLQDLLGYANDYAVARRQLDGLLADAHGEGGADLQHAAGAIVGWHGAEMARADGRIADAWEDFRACARFWPKPNKKR